MEYVNLNPFVLSMKGLPKIRKVNSPITPVINWQNAPAYKLVKLLSKLLQLHVPLPKFFNVKNSLHLMNNSVEIPPDQNLQLASCDVETCTQTSRPMN